MTDVIVDASVAAKWVLPEVDSAHALRVFADVAAAGGVSVVLDVAAAEVVNVIWKWHRRKLISTTEADQFLANWLNYPKRTEESQRLLAASLSLAIRYGCAVYDALFLALMSDMGARGVRPDEPLYRAAKSDFPDLVLLKNW